MEHADGLLSLDTVVYMDPCIYLTYGTHRGHYSMHGSVYILNKWNTQTDFLVWMRLCASPYYRAYLVMKK